eukprot:scaffold200008_cov47-Prasinocladus_malaysianus.AAC.1
MTLTTLAGEPLNVTINNGTVMINEATVVLADIETGNGVVHVIDEVLISPEIFDENAEPELPDSVVDIVVYSPNHIILETAVIKAELAEPLSGEGPFTVFAPTDAAFEQALEALNITAGELLSNPDL